MTCPSLPVSDAFRLPEAKYSSYALVSLILSTLGLNPHHIETFASVVI